MSENFTLSCRMSPEYQARSVLAAFPANDLRRAAEAALSFVRLKGSVDAQPYALCALIAEKKGLFLNALKFWDYCIEHSRDCAKYLENAFALAWRLEGKLHEASEYTAKWLPFFESLYTFTPSFGFLKNLEARGYRIPGVYGLAQGRLTGWLFLKKNEKLILKSNLTVSQIQLSMQPIAADAQDILYSLQLSLPSGGKAFHISLSDASGIALKGSPLICSPAEAGQRQGQNLKKSSKPTVIIPVYGDRKATLSCIASVLASQKKNRSAFDICIVWDNGPDGRLKADLRRLSSQGKILLLENEHNLGFLASINQALSQIHTGHVILLNADTLVHGDWVDRLLAAACFPDAGTVTAMGSQAELMSFPSPYNRGQITDLATTAKIDTACARLPVKEAVLPMPVAVGFCMLITRSALNAVGGLDGHSLCKGYGEECDYSFRVKKAGFINYGAWNVFVAHLQGRSFGGAKRALAIQNNAVLRKKFPDYEEKFTASLLADRAKPIRQRISRDLAQYLQPLTLELMPWAYALQPFWDLEEPLASLKPRAALFIKYAAAIPVEARLKVRGDFPLSDMDFMLPRDNAELARVLDNFPICEYQGFSDSQIRAIGLLLPKMKFYRKIRPRILGRISPQAKLPGKDYFCALPASLEEARGLLRLASVNPSTYFYIYEKEKYLGKMPLPLNILSFSGHENYLALEPAAMLFPSEACDLEGWQAWLAQINNSLACFTLEKAP